jgi:WD40 repeat protein
MARLPVGLMVVVWVVLAANLSGGNEPPQAPRGGAAGNSLPTGAIARLGVPRFQNVGRVFAVAFSPDGKTLAAASWDGVIRLWDVATGKELRRWERQNGWIKSLAFSPDGLILAAPGPEVDISLWETATGELQRRLRGHQRGYEPMRIAFSPDGKVLASKGPDKTFRLWDVATGREVFRIAQQGYTDAVVAFSPDGKTVATVTNNTTVSRWEVATGKDLQPFTKPEHDVKALAFSPDGKVLAGSGGAMLRLWEATTGKELATLLDFSYSTGTSLAFAPDGKSLARAGGDETIRVWELASRRERCRFQGVERGEVCLAYSPDGRVLASGSTDLSVLLWDVTGRLRDGRLQPLSLSPDELQTLWADLASDDAPKAHGALWKLVAAAPQSVPFLKQQLPPVRPADPVRTAQLLRDLDNDQFAVRTRARQELARLGESAEPPLRAALRGKPSLEKRRSVEQLLDRLAERWSKQMRVVRALEVLEHIGTAEARQVLAELARGAPAARLTEEAQASMERLAKRQAAVP